MVTRPPTVPGWDLNPQPFNLEESAILTELMRPDNWLQDVFVTTFDLPKSVYVCSTFSSCCHAKEDLDIIHELVCKYRTTHQVLIIGDLNEHHYIYESVKESPMKDLISEHSASDLGEKINDKFTYRCQ